MMLTNVVDTYLAKQRSLGMRFESAGVLLRGFCRAMGNRDIGEVTPDAVAEFLQGKGSLSATWMLRYKVLSGLYRFAVSRGYTAFSPLPTTFPKLPPQRIPYVYSTQELRRLLGTTSILTGPFMNERQREYFRMKLLAWKNEVLKEVTETLRHLQDENQNHSDFADRASSEADRAIELRRPRPSAQAGP